MRSAPFPERFGERGAIQSVKSVESVVKPFACLAKFAVPSVVYDPEKLTLSNTMVGVLKEE